MPPPGDGAEVDLDALARVFLSPDDMSAELAEKFDLIGQMSGKDAMDQIVDTVQRRNLPIVFGIAGKTCLGLRSTGTWLRDA